jgi:hypothetical protein
LLVVWVSLMRCTVRGRRVTSRRLSSSAPALPGRFSPGCSRLRGEFLCQDTHQPPVRAGWNAWLRGRLEEGDRRLDRSEVGLTFRTVVEVLPDLPASRRIDLLVKVVADVSVRFSAVHVCLYVSGLKYGWS